MSDARSTGRVARGLAAVAAGAVAGAVVEEVLARRVLRVDAHAGADIRPPDGEGRTITSFDGTAIHTTTVGRRGAPPVILAHGIIESSAIWHYQARDSVLADRYELIVYDARGHGGSGAARGPRGTTSFTSQAHARDLAAVIEAATSGPVVVVGHSMGGMAVQALWDVASSARERVAGAVLVNTTFTAELAGWRGEGSRPQRAFERIEDLGQRVIGSERIVHRLRPGRSDLAMLGARLVYGRAPSPAHIAASVRMYDATPSATIAASVDLATADLHHVLPHIDVPVLVVAGTHDRITPAWLSDEITARIPAAELVVLEGCGHAAPFERHEELNGLIAKFCERVL